MMKKKKSGRSAALSPLENAVMQVVWSDQPVTADAVRQKLQGQHELKDSTIRTLLRRLEEKGYVDHDVDGRTYVYRAKVEQNNVATTAVRGIVDRFCSGSVENLLIGLVDDRMISPERLRELANQIAQAEAQQTKPPSRKRR
ncbi:MAG: BlaI/MecI/CopY family transcriptional regulator [Planctomycetaceae bacterium]|nr:BlaI/MecI/CopY family transcriptional regulator [Planctomycetaceae bacterium]